MTGSILGGAFRLLRQHPLSVLVWAILYLIGIFSIGLLRVAMVPAGPQTMVGLLAAAVLSQGLTLALVAVLITAATRATLHPYKRGAYYLRLGGNEVRVFALLAMLAIALLLLLGWSVLIGAFFAPVLGDLFANGLRAETLAQALVRVTLAGRALPVFAQFTLIVGSLVLMALGFVLSTATLASAARAMLGLKEGQIEDLRRVR